MAPDSERSARWATILLAAAGYAACEIASHPDGKPAAFDIGLGLAILALAIVGGYILPRRRPGHRSPPFRVTLILVAAFTLPVALDPILREWWGYGLPYELQLVNGLRNLGLALSAAAAWPMCRRLTAVVALFLALFAAAMGDQPAIPYALAAVAISGGLWLVLNYQADRIAATTATAGVVVERVRLRIPVRETVVFGALALVAISMAVAGPTRVVATLGELVPTSGGTGDQDPFARSGTNDGPEETAGNDPSAAGMVESDTFIESQKDSLLDVIGDMYGPPHKPPKDQERTVAGGQERVKSNHGKLPENRRPNREFETARQGPKEARKGDSRGPRGLFEVFGRTPLHIAAVVYDRYDAADRRWLQATPPSTRLIEADPTGEFWMIPASRRNTGDWYANDDRHQLKVADLKDRLVPTPANTSRFRIRKVERPDSYEWDYDGVLGLAGRTRTPSGITIHTDCRTLDSSSLPAEAFAAGGFQPVYLEVPPELAPMIGQVAWEWVGDRPRGWPQIEAIRNRLRDGFTLDRKAAAPADHPHPVLWFLGESFRGPDYLFATASALLLRSLGYPARVCLGYYAAPEAYDADSDHTPVKSTDLHVWPEVLLRDGHWLVVEPTPGYGVLPPKRPWIERAWTAVVGWAGRHPFEISAVVLGLGLLLWRRRAISDAVFTATWRIVPGRTWQRTVLRTTRLLERRARLAGRARRPSETLAEWAGLDGDGVLGRLVGLAECAAYAPTLPPPLAVDAIYPLCRRAVGRWKRSRFRVDTSLRGAI